MFLEADLQAVCSVTEARSFKVGKGGWNHPVDKGNG